MFRPPHPPEVAVRLVLRPKTISFWDREIRGKRGTKIRGLEGQDSEGYWDIKIEGQLGVGGILRRATAESNLF